MTASGISLSIQAGIGTDGKIIFRGEGAPPFEVQSGLDAIQLAALRQRVGKALDVFRASLANLNQASLAHVIAATGELHRQGKQILRDLFSRDLLQVQAASDYCRLACPAWQQTGWQDEALAPNMVEIDARPEDGLVLEILPLFNPRWEAAGETMEDLAQLVSSFLGFSAIVQRGRQPVTGKRLENIPHLPVNMFWYGNLPLAARTRRFFEGEPEFELSQVWPESKPAAPATELARLLWRHDLGKNGVRRDRPVEVHHFHCHCDAKQPSASDYALKLRTAGFLATEKRITLGDLVIAIDNERDEDNGDTALRPLVFLNACAGAQTMPGGIGSFPDTLGKGFAGFIGTEAVIPEAFAYEFAVRFYAQVLAGRSLGEAMYQARWSILRSYKNPLGILYTLHADADIRVRRPVPSALARRPTIDGFA